ncbi:transposase [Candidatus Uabimicrobium sp. HlEnr_7]
MPLSKDNMIEAVLYRYKAGIPWRDLFKKFGNFRVKSTRYNRWAEKGSEARLADKAYYAKQHVIQKLEQRNILTVLLNLTFKSRKNAIFTSINRAT